MGGRRFVFPEPGDTVASLAARMLPDDPDGATTLLSWNLHLAVRPRPLLGTDIVYVEPPT